MRLCSVLLVCLLVGGSGIAGAQGPVANDSAALKELFNRATTHFNLGKFKEAAAEYEQLYEAHPDPVLLYNIAQAHRLEGDSGRALFFYKRYLINNPSASNRAEVENRISDLEHLVAEEHKTQSRPPNEPAPLGRRANGEPESVAPPATGDAPTTSPPTATTTDANASTTSRNDRAATPIYKKWWLWTIVGVVVVGAAVGIGVGVAESGGSSFHPNFPVTGPGAATSAISVRF